MLRLDVEARLGDRELEVALAVPRGACLALAGPSGAGKSSVLRAVAGLLRPRAGEVACGEETWLDTARGIDVAPERRRCGFVFQDYALFGHLSAWRNVAYGLRGSSRAARRARARELLGRLGLEGREDARPSDLSGGERQRVALARALARAPRAWLLDEPLSALDARTRAAAGREVIAILRESGAPALVVTHDFMEAALLGDRVAVLDEGRVVQEGAPGEVAAAPRSAFVAAFTGAVVLTGVARPAPGGLTLVELDGGGLAASADPGSGPVAIGVYPWEVELRPSGSAGGGSARNRVEAEVVSLTPVGNRVRVGLQAGQPLAAEVTEASARELGLGPGARVTATWKAAATRVMPR